MRDILTRRNAVAVLFAAAWVLAAVWMARRGLVVQANGLVAAGLFLTAYYASRAPALCGLALYLVVAPGQNLAPFDKARLGNWLGWVAPVLYVVITAAGIHLLHRLRFVLRQSKESERTLRLISENTTDLILAYDMNRRLIYVNPAVERLIGYTVEDMKRRHFIKWLHPEDEERILRLWQGVFEGRGYADVEFRAVTPRNGLMWFSGTWAPILDERGKQIGVQGVDRDITARKRAEEELRESQIRYKNLLDSIDGIVWEADARTFQFQFVSQKAEQILGYPVARWLEEPDFWVNHLHPEDREPAVTFCVESTRQLKDHDFEYRMLAADGRVVWLRDLVTVVGEGGRAKVLQGIMVDITSQKETGEALLAARDQALEAARAKSYFLATVSHELRTPMNGILGMSGLLLDSGLSGDQREMAEAVKNCGESLLNIINDILDLSKAEAGKLELEVIDFSLRRVVQDVMDLLRGQAGRKQLALGFHIDDAVPDNLRGDPGRLRQVLLNLVGNAIKFTERGEVELSCRIESTASFVTVRFEVRDTGPGIPPEVIPRLFQPFSQADMATTRRFGGTGLGLAICREVVQKMSGRIGVESEPGVGSRFWFTVKLEKQSQCAGQAAASKAGPPAMKMGASVLVVEDNSVNQVLMLRMLEKLGCSPALASNGREAVESVERASYDIVLMDCQMPEMDGYEATRRIRERESGPGHLPIIAITASAMKGDREKCLEAGMDDYLSKPVALHALAEKLNQWASRDPVEARSPQESSPKVR